MQNVSEVEGRGGLESKRWGGRELRHLGADADDVGVNLAKRKRRARATESCLNVAVEPDCLSRTGGLGGSL